MIEKPHDQISRATPLMPWLDRHKACDEAIEAAEKAGWATLGEAWDQCSDVGWLLWGLAQEGYSDESVLRMFACRCMRETPLLGGGVVGDLLADPRSRGALEVTERFARGQASTQELTTARAEAWAAVWMSPEVEASGAAAWAAQAAVWVAGEDATGAAQTAAWAAHTAARVSAQAAVRDTAWEVAWDVVWEDGEVVWPTWDTIRAGIWVASWADGGVVSVAWNAGRTAAAKFQTDLLRKMIDPFHSDESK